MINTHAHAHRNYIRLLNIYDCFVFFVFCFFAELANISALDGPGGKLPAVRNRLKKPKNVNLIKLIEKRNRVNRKEHTSFLSFKF